MAKRVWGWTRPTWHWEVEVTARRRMRRLASNWVPGLLALVLALAGVGAAAAETYTVQPGDTISDIGDRYGVDADAIARANGLADADLLSVGQQLSIPTGAAASVTGGTYTVAEGDTLGAIADRLGVTQSALIAANSLTDPSYLRIGQQLKVPGAGGTVTTPAVASGDSGAYIVTPGDTLSGIADAFGLSATAIAVANGLNDPDSLSVGEKLVLPAHPELAARGGRPLSFVWPAFGEITTYFHEAGSLWVGGYHQGLDIGADYGSIIRAAADGTVIEAGPHPSYGNYVKIDHGGGVQTLYAHQSRIAVDVGEEVSRGQTIGYIGSTGVSTGPHLHFEVRVNGEKVDPLLYLP